MNRRVLSVLVGLLALSGHGGVYAQSGDIIVLRAPNHPLESLEAAAARVMLEAPDPAGMAIEIPNYDMRPLPPGFDGATLHRDPLLKDMTPSSSTVLGTSFAGSDNTDNGINVTPPDANGDVSNDRIVQMINLVTTVFDKSGSIVAGGGPFFSNAFWAGHGGLCETNNNGDPIVAYDEAGDRWLVSQFAFNSTSAPPWRQCVAVSQTGDPLGAYNRYEFNFDAIGFPDYPKHGIVTSAITVTANLFNPGFAGTFVGAIDKGAVYAGGAATLVGANLGVSEYGFLPGDLDDPTGTAGAVPALFATAMTTAGLFDIWEIVPDFTTAANTTTTRIERVPIAGFDSDICSASRERCIPHSGSGDNLEAQSGQLMNRLQIRDFGTYMTMVAAHTIDADAAPPGADGRAGVRWHEIRSTDGGSTWFLHQEGTLALNDGLDRFMPSIAMNVAGDLGLGYMVSSASTAPEIRVAGQHTSESGTGALTSSEATCRSGVAGSDWSGRAGDYSATTVDPVTDMFWHTNEYGRDASFRGWGTFVCEFSMDIPLPVNLVSFDARVFDGMIELDWVTESEENNVGFAIEMKGPGLRSQASSGWVEVGFVEGNGTSATQTEYSYSIEGVLPGVHRVRLKQVDTDGSFGYGPDIEVTLETPAKFVLEPAYPNPFNPSTTIRFAVSKTQRVVVDLFDQMGRLVATLLDSEVSSDQMHTVRILAEGLPPALYVVSFKGETFVETERLIVVK